MATTVSPQARAGRRGPAGALWLVQAISGLLLVLVLGLHMVAHHFVVEGGLRDYAQVRANGIVDAAVAEEALSLLEIDDLGLDDLDRRVLDAIIVKFSGGPVGLDTLAASISEEPDTIMDVVEPYLLQLGFLDRTPRGRVATRAAYAHMRIAYPERPEQGGLFA